MLPLLLMFLPAGAWALIGVFFMISICIAGLFYIIAGFFQTPQLKAVANEEIAALFFSMFIIVFWIGSTETLNVFTSAIAGVGPASGSGSAAMQLSDSHINLAIRQTDIFISQLRNKYMELFAMDFLVSFMSTLSFNLFPMMGGIGIPSLHIAPYASLGPISSSLTQVVDGTGLLVMAVWSKKMILIFSRDVAPLILFPIGLILRSNPFSRSTGSSVIAIAIALYLVFPITVMMSYYMIFDLYKLDLDQRHAQFLTPFRTAIDAQSMQNTIESDDQKIRAQYEESAKTAEQIANEACCGRAECSLWSRLLCSVDRFVDTATKTVQDKTKNWGTLGTVAGGIAGFIHVIWETSNNVLTFSGGLWNFLTAGPKALVPTKMTAMLYEYLTNSVSKLAEIFILVTATTIIEIMLTVTMYRNISLLIGGEPEIAGLTKIV